MLLSAINESFEPVEEHNKYQHERTEKHEENKVIIAHLNTKRHRFVPMCDICLRTVAKTRYLHGDQSQHLIPTLRWTQHSPSCTSNSLSDRSLMYDYRSRILRNVKADAVGSCLDSIGKAHCSSRKLQAFPSIAGFCPQSKSSSSSSSQIRFDFDWRFRMIAACFSSCSSTSVMQQTFLPHKPRCGAHTMRRPITGQQSVSPRQTSARFRHDDESKPLKETNVAHFSNGFFPSKCTNVVVDSRRLVSSSMTSNRFMSL